MYAELLLLNIYELQKAQNSLIVNFHYLMHWTKVEMILNYKFLSSVHEKC